MRGNKNGSNNYTNKKYSFMMNDGKTCKKSKMIWNYVEGNHMMWHDVKWCDMI